MGVIRGASCTPENLAVTRLTVFSASIFCDVFQNLVDNTRILVCIAFLEGK